MTTNGHTASDRAGTAAIAPAGTAAPASQTLDRGLRLLAAVAEAPAPLAIGEAAAAVGLHRSVAYRLLRTLEDHRLVRREAGDRFTVGYGVVSLSRRAVHDLAAAASGELHALADDVDLAAFLMVREGEEAMTVLVAEPTSPGNWFTQRVGSRHPVGQGAPGAALASFDAPAEGERDAVRLVRDRGWCSSTGEVFEGVTSVAAPVPGYRVPASVAVTYVGERPHEGLGPRVAEAARRISRRLA